MTSKETEHKIKIARIGQQKYVDIDDKDFVIRPLKKMRLIDVADGLDDECEFEKSMYNFGDEDDLPDSDRAVDMRCKNS